MHAQITAVVCCHMVFALRCAAQLQCDVGLGDTICVGAAASCAAAAQRVLPAWVPAAWCGPAGFWQ
jgi:hypothetical protein